MLSKILMRLVLSTSLALAKPCKPDILPTPDIPNTNSTLNATSIAATVTRRQSTQLFISESLTQSRTGNKSTTSTRVIIGPALPPTRSATYVELSAASGFPIGTSSAISYSPSSSSTRTTRGYPKLSSPMNSLSTSTTSAVGSLRTKSFINGSPAGGPTASNSPLTSLQTTSSTKHSSPKFSLTSDSSISAINKIPTSSLATDSLTTDSSATDSSTPGSSPPTSSLVTSTSTLDSSASSTRISLTSTTITSSSVVTTSSSLTTTSSSESDSSTSTASSSAVANPTFYLQASDVTLRREPNDTIEDPNLYRSNGLYAQLYTPYYSEYLTFAVADPGPPAATFYINGNGHLVHAENGWILNTQPDYLSHQVNFDEDPYEDDYAPPNCKIDQSSLILSCSITRQKEFSICFGSSESRLGNNGKLYMTGNAFNQGRQCRAVTLNVRPI